MLNIKELSILLKQTYSRATSDWRKSVTGLARQWWAGFVLLLTLAIVIVAWPGLSLFSGLSLLLWMLLLGWVAWQWRSMQFSVVIIVLLSVTVMVMKTASPLISYLLPVMGIQLIACFFAAIVVDLGKTRLTVIHVSYLCWSVIISGVLLLILRGSISLLRVCTMRACH